MKKRWSKGLIVAAASGLALAASSGPLQARPAQPLAADLLLYNGKVLTVDGQNSIKSVVVVRNGRIIAVGDAPLRRKYKAARQIDLGGRTLLPGFTDTHLHPMATAPSDIDVAAARSVADVQAMLRVKAAQLGPGKWITGYGWQESNLAEDRNLSRADLDAGAPANPVMLVRAGGHSSVSNSMALKLAGIDRSTPDPKSGLLIPTSPAAVRTKLVPP